MIDAAPLFAAEHLALLRWASRYYQHPVGEVVFTALPGLLRQGKTMPETPPPPEKKPADPVAAIKLNPDQAAALKAIDRREDGYRAHLLQGVTGSGKTEVYIELSRRIIAAGRQALILVPEIGLTPQFLQRLQQRLPAVIAVLHSKLGEAQRLQNWLAARDGRAQVIVGTRSAVWTPLKNPGLFIVDEEHDLSYKQETGFRYSARDVAVMRARMAAAPVVLGSATPSLESVRNARAGKFQLSRLRQRAAGAAAPAVKLINLQNQQIRGAFSQTLLQALQENLDAGNQSLLFLNRRGYAPAIFCHGCGWIARCPRCSINMTWHQAEKKLLCHHCERRRPLPAACPECGGGRLLQVGHGTQRLSHTIAELFPRATVLRIDRDSTRRRGSMREMIAQIESGAAQILVGTQMLAKGHHFPAVTLVGIVDADGGLLGADFRATERMAQLITQVSGRAGRADKPGAVYIQTHYPEHPLLQRLLRKGYDAFAASLLRERREAGLPPFRYLALLRAEAQDGAQAVKFLDFARARLARATTAITLSGPYVAPIEKKQGRRRYQLLLQTGDRRHFQSRLGAWLETLENSAEAKKTRWSLDIDPQDML